MSTKIMLIEDDSGVLEALQILLSDEGYQVMSVTEISQAIETVIHNQPDLIFLDLLLSGANGMDICRELKANSQTRLIPIIMISAHPQAKKSAMNCGADFFLPKPFDIDELLDTTKQLLSTPSSL